MPCGLAAVANSDSKMKVAIAHMPERVVVKLTESSLQTSIDIVYVGCHVGQPETDIKEEYWTMPKGLGDIVP